MTRGNQREIDRARAQARAKKNGGNRKEQGGTDYKQKAMDSADIMREKQRKAELRKQGIDPDAEDNKPKKQYDMSWMQQYQAPEEEEEKKDE